MITKEQWNEIENKLQSIFALKKFRLGSDEITIAREFVKEGQSKLVVYLNGTIKFSWTHRVDDEHYNPLVAKFWHCSSRAIYGKKYKAAMIKIYGKKRVKQECPELEKRYVNYSPFWPRAKTLVNHLKKIPDLELID